MNLHHLLRRLLPYFVAICCALAPTVDTWAETVSRRVHLMGTWLTIEVSGTDRRHALELSEGALAAIRAAELRLSTWRPDSELSLLNRQPSGSWTTISPALAEDLRAALAWSRHTEGAFQPLMAPLVAAWDLRGRGRIPDARELAAALSASRTAAFQIDGNAARRLSPQAAIEEGGFGKGAALRDAVAAIGVTTGACVNLNLGGQVVRFGACTTTRIILADPGNRARGIAWLELGKGSVATSGQAERRYRAAGLEFGHILDPVSGRPVPAWGSVSVVHPDPLAADCLATALFAMGPTRATVWLETHPEIDAILARRDASRATLGVTPHLVMQLGGLSPGVRTAPIAAVGSSHHVQTVPETTRAVDPE